MKESHILTGPPVTLCNSQPMRQARHSDTAQAFQDGLQRTAGKSSQEIIRMDVKAAKERAKYKRWKK